MPRDFRLHRTPFDVLNYEIVEEQAAALGRIGRALEAALARLRDFDAAHPRAGAPVSVEQARRILVLEAGHALWMLLVQREACGLRDSRTVMRDYHVPGEVQRRIGVGYIRPLGAGKMTNRVHDRAELTTELELPERESKQPAVLSAESR